MSVDVAFETPEQVAAKLTHYEELFKFRYTERDDEYRQCLNNASRVLQVPVMNPWPPRGVYSRGRGRYDDWDGGGRRRGYRGRRRDYHHHPYHHPPRYYDDRPPWREDYRDRSPLRSISPHSHFHYRRHGSSSPLPYPPPPPHPPQLSPHHYPPHPSPPHQSHYLSPRHHPHRSRSRSHSPSIRPHSHSPHRERQIEMESSNEQEAPPQPHPLSYEDPEEKAVIPSESDVLDILSSAHALQSQLTAENLRQAQIEGRKSHRSRREEKMENRTGKKIAVSGVGKTRDDPKVSALSPPGGSGPSTGTLLVTHGRTQTVSTSDLLGGGVDEGRGRERGRGGGGRGRGGKDIPQKRLRPKQRKSTITESEDEGERVGRDGGGVGGGHPHTELSSVAGTEKEASEERGLVMKVDKKFCHSDSLSSLSGSSVASHSVPNTPSSELTPTLSHEAILGPFYTTHRDLRVVCSRLPTTTTTTVPAAQSTAPPGPPPSVTEPNKDKKKKKKKKKHKSSGSGDKRSSDNELLTQGPLKLKISLGRPQDP